MRGATIAAATGLLCLANTPALALPTMIRLGYSNCAVCHVSPQGGGPLSSYGRGVDEAQSLRAGEYRPSDNRLIRSLGWRGRIAQDVRLVMQEQVTWRAEGTSAAVWRPRLMYRNVTEIGKGLRLSGTVTGGTHWAQRPSLSYEPAPSPSSVFVSGAMLQYRASETFELAAGRDQLPTGINNADLATFVRSRNRVGDHDAPTQLKAFYWGKRYHVSPFVYLSRGDESATERESGGGSLAEFDLLGRQRTVLGVTALRGSSKRGTRSLLGGYARLGFGAWGVLAEHDVIERSRTLPSPGSFRQDATYAQLFWAVREWLVVSAAGERLRVEVPFEERLFAGKLDMTARLASHATLSVGARFERDATTKLLTSSAMVQAAFKTVN